MARDTIVIQYTSREGIQNARGGGGGQYRSESDFMTAGQKSMPGALNHLAKGMDHLGGALYKQELQKRETIMQLELLNDVQAHQAASQKFIDDYQQEYQGKNAMNAEQDYSTWNTKQADALKKKWDGNDRALLYLQQHAGSVAVSGGNAMRDYSNQQLGAWKDQTFQAEQAHLDQSIATDPMNVGSYTAQKISSLNRMHPEKPPEWIAAKANEIAINDIKLAYDNALATGDIEAAHEIFKRAAVASSKGMGRPVNIPAAAQLYMDTVNEASETFGVPANMILAVMKTESGFDAGAVSKTGVRGLMQVTQSTYNGLGFTGDRSDPNNSIMAGTKLLGQLYQQYGNWPDALAAYNGGDGAVQGLKTGRWSSNINPDKQREVKAYAPTVLKNLAAIGDGGDGTEAGGLMPLGDLAAMQKAMNAAMDARIIANKEAVIQKYQELDLAGTLTEGLLLEDSDFKTLPYDEQLFWRKVARGEAGNMGRIQTNTKKALESEFYAAAETGAIPKTRSGLLRWLATPQKVGQEEYDPWDFLDRSDFNKFMTYVEKEAGRLNTEVDNYLNYHTGLIKQPADRFIFKQKAIKFATERHLSADSPELAGLLADMLQNNNFLKGEYSASAKYSASDTVRNQVEYEQDRTIIRQSGLPETSINFDRAGRARTEGKPIREVFAPEAKQWPGKGLVTLDSVDRRLWAEKEVFEEMGNSFNADPNFIFAVAQAVSGGDKFANGQLSPGRVGLMQLDLKTAEELGLNKETMFDVRENVRVATEILKTLADKNNGDFFHALAIYASDLPPDKLSGFISDVRHIYNDNYGQWFDFHDYKGYGAGHKGYGQLKLDIGPIVAPNQNKNKVDESESKSWGQAAGEAFTPTIKAGLRTNPMTAPIAHQWFKARGKNDE
ncbi:hypothetical protein C4J81_17120 [Deltaproteobacteria bacterium Smac51]|nr:hypothetical protein C4J81_17120 [Deltaproteobacteria bacterium Smac51]